MFPDGKSFYRPNSSQYLSDFSMASSISYGCNRNGRPYNVPYLCNLKINQLQFGSILTTILLLGGASPLIAALLPILINFIAAISSIFYLAQFYSPSHFTPYIAIFFFLFSLRDINSNIITSPNQFSSKKSHDDHSMSSNSDNKKNYQPFINFEFSNDDHSLGFFMINEQRHRFTPSTKHPPELIFDGDTLIALSFALFGKIILISGIGDHFHFFIHFILSAIFQSLIILTSSSIYIYSLYFDIFLLLFTFPFFRINRWKEVLGKWFTYFFILIVFIVLFSPFYDFLSSFSIDFRNPLNLWKKFGTFIVLSTIFPLLKKRNKNSLVFDIYLSSLFSLLLSCFFSPENSSTDQMIIAWLPYGSIIAADLLTTFITPTFRSRSRFSSFGFLLFILLFLSVIVTPFIHSALYTRKLGNSYFNEDNQRIGNWIIKNTHPDKLFFYLGKELDPSVLIAGRQTFMATQSHYLPYDVDIPKKKRELLYYYLHVDSDYALDGSDITYLMRYSNDTHFGPMININTLPNWQKIKETKNWQIFKRIYPL